MTDEEKKAIEYLTKYIHFETYGERSLDTDINTVLNLIEKQEKVIDKIKDYCNSDLSFERILKRDNRTPDLFNQGRFYTCQNIKDIIDGKVENNDKS